MALCLCTMMISSCGDNIDELEGNEITGYKSDDGGFIFRLFEDMLRLGYRKAYHQKSLSKPPPMRGGMGRGFSLSSDYISRLPSDGGC